MNVFVVDPEWGWLILAYFYLGGLAAGAYFSAALLETAVGETARPLARLGYGLAVVLLLVCGALLTVDLGQPLRFWHMLFRSEVVHRALAGDWAALAAAPLLKPWSPMSLGSWALTVFGLCAALSLLGAWRPDGRGTRWLARGWLAHGVRAIGCL